MKYIIIALITSIALFAITSRNGYCEDWKHFFNGGNSQFFYDKENVKTPKQTGSFYYETSLLKNNSLGSLVVGVRVICSSKMITFGGFARRYDSSSPANLLSSNPAKWDEWKKPYEPEYQALIRNICSE